MITTDRTRAILAAAMETHRTLAAATVDLLATPAAVAATPAAVAAIQAAVEATRVEAIPVAM